ncbi:MAG: linear amide C-N hydrolase [Candidatus Nanopelagicales bacterium]
MCTDIRLVRLADRHISGRTLDFGYEVNSKVRVVPRGQRYEAVETGTAVETLSWSNTLGFVGMDAFGFEWAICDGLNEVGLSVGTLWLPETKLPTEPPTSGDAAAIDFVHLAAWLLGTCKTVADARAALESVQIWNAPVKRLWPSSEPMPDMLKPLTDYAFTEHLTIHDAAGGDLVVEFLDGHAVFHDNVIGVLTNSPTYDWHTTNLRNYIGLTNVESKPVNLMGMPVAGTGNGTGLLGMPGDVTPASRFIRATVLTEVTTTAKDTRDAINQTFHSLDLVSVPRFLAASGDYTQWYVARDHDEPTYYVRTYDGWTTDVHRLSDLGVGQDGEPKALELPKP